MNSRPFNFRLALGLPLLLMAGLLLFDPVALDFALARLFYEPGVGFIGRHNFWLEDILHDRAKQLVILLAVIAIAAFLVSLLPTRVRPWRRHLGYLVLALVLSTSIVTPLKTLTAMHCPWSLSEFGGEEHFSSLLAKRAPTEKPGRCWPAGHASTGFSLLALYFALRDRSSSLVRPNTASRPRSSQRGIFFCISRAPHLCRQMFSIYDVIKSGTRVTMFLRRPNSRSSKFWE